MLFWLWAATPFVVLAVALFIRARRVRRDVALYKAGWLDGRRPRDVKVTITADTSKFDAACKEAIAALERTKARGY